MKKILLVLASLIFLAGCGGGSGGGNNEPPPPNAKWNLIWKQPTTFTDNSPLDPANDIIGFRIYITPLDVDFIDENNPPVVVGDVPNELKQLVDQNEVIFTQQINFTDLVTASLDNTVNVAKGDCTYWVSIIALVPQDGNMINSQFAAPFPWGPDFCINY